MSAMPFVTETFAPLWRARTYATALYLLLALPIGFVAFLLLTVGGSVGTAQPVTRAAARREPATGPLAGSALSPQTWGRALHAVREMTVRS